MKKLLLLLFILLSVYSFSAKVSINEAKIVGINYMNYINHDFNTNVIEEITISYQNYDVIYAYNFKNGGYILISADDKAYPILSYAFEGSFKANDNNMPPAYTRWIQWFEDQIILAKTTNIKPLAKTIESWRNFSNENITNEKSINTVNPLLDIDDIKWDQGCYYNADCPSDANGACGHVYVGCVATAMSQIMRYFKFPNSGNGSHSFNDSYGTQSANFGSANYDWNAMPGQISSANAEIAKISYHAGVSVDMQYSANGSGAHSSDVRDALVGYFTYSTDATYASRSSYNDAQWKTLIKTSLDNGWPVYYSGDDGSNVGHAFVCDGYNNNDEYHFNWGWSGDYNSWNTLDDIVPGGTGAGGGAGDYSQGNRIVYNIHPDLGLTANFNSDVTSISEGGQVNFNDISSNGGSAITSWSWTFTGGTPSSFNGQNPPAITYNNAGTYEVSLSITNTDGDSDTETKTAYITVNPQGNSFSLDFELPENYSQDFTPWSNIDNDGEVTYSSSDCDFPGEASAFSFMAFNPSDAGFSLANAHGGQRCGMAICPADGSAADNWIISDKLTIGINAKFNFWVLTPKPDSWGNESFNVLISTTNNNLSSFSTIASAEEAPDTWTQKSYDLSSYLGQDVYLAIQHISVDKFIFWVDDIEITEGSSKTDNIIENNISIYPNPSTGIINISGAENSRVEILNSIGVVVFTNNNISSTETINISDFNNGTYFVKIISDKIIIKKIIIIK